MAYIYRFFFPMGAARRPLCAGFICLAAGSVMQRPFWTLVAHDQGLDREEGKEDRKERGKKRGGTTQISFNFLGGFKLLPLTGIAVFLVWALKVLVFLNQMIFDKFFHFLCCFSVSEFLFTCIPL